MIATLISQSILTGQIVTKCYNLSKTLILKNIPIHINKISVEYHLFTNTCQIKPIWEGVESPNYRAVYTLDANDHDIFSKKTDKEMIEEFCERNHKVTIQVDEFYEP